jgi:hypothetical protein
MTITACRFRNAEIRASAPANSACISSIDHFEDHNNMVTTYRTGVTQNRQTPDTRTETAGSGFAVLANACRGAT